eukprot:GHVU01100489.1.p1 GENE.GHVU01100489.1~~GHVU01100489.1.p1  ORF type:complete len:153 (-),score=30.17 GHVU01100489.1:467-925(-)
MMMSIMMMMKMIMMMMSITMMSISSYRTLRVSGPHGRRVSHLPHRDALCSSDGCRGTKHGRGGRGWFTLPLRCLLLILVVVLLLLLRLSALPSVLLMLLTWRRGGGQQCCAIEIYYAIVDLLWALGSPELEGVEGIEVDAEGSQKRVLLERE